jgi:hypothetical protein
MKLLLLQTASLSGHWEVRQSASICMIHGLRMNFLGVLCRFKKKGITAFKSSRIDVASWSMLHLRHLHAPQKVADLD